jgi:mRNA-degrading endonuclease RelE of RelBE toxin-antitoxin system
VPKYRVLAHRRVHKFLTTLTDKKLKHNITNHIKKLENYPITLTEMDTKKITGLEKTFRIRIGKYRIIFHVDTSKQIVYITHAGTIKKVYTKLD